MRTEDLERAVDFIHREGRLLERRITDAVLDGHSPEPVVDAVRAYRNPDGGLGYGLEPDVRAPGSQPLDIEVAWQSFDWVGVAPAEIVLPACDHLASIGAGVSCVTPTVREHPHAPHWRDASHEPSLNPTAGLAGHLWRWGIDHPWRDEATSFCWSALADVPPSDAHTAIGVLRFLEHVPDRERADRVVDALRPALPTLAWLHHDPGAAGYGVTPLQLVPDPASTWPDLFRADIVAGHLDVLEATQEDDGGWEIAWPTIGPAARSEWRGRRTLEHLLVLRAYGRVG
jgi:hypothetical protein